MKEENIWENLNLSEENLKTAYTYLISQADNFKNASKGILNMEIEVRQLESSDASKRKMTLYVLVVVAPYLGNFRKKLIHIAEFEDQGRFPVNLWDYINDVSIVGITEDNLLRVVKEALSSSKIKVAIENLFRQSIEAKSDHKSST